MSGANVLTEAEQRYLSTGDESALGGAPEPEPNAQPSPEREVVDHGDGAEREPETPEEQHKADAKAAEGKPLRDDKGKFVPHQAMHEEREGRKAAERAREEDRARWESEKTELLRAFAQQLGQQQPAPQQQQAPRAEEPPLPDRNTDPIAYFEAVISHLQRENQEFRQFRAQTAEQTQQQAALQQVRYLAQAQIEQFAQRQPDYNDAMRFMQAQRAAELQAMGYQPAQVSQQIQAETQMAMQNAVQQGRDFAQMAYAVAKARGYAPKATEQPAQTQPTVPQSPAQPEPNTEAERLATVARGQQLAGSGGGSPAPARMTLERLTRMTPEEIAKFSKENKAEFARLAG